MLALLLAERFAGSFLVAALLGGFGSPTFLCIAGSRMFFNVKEAAEYGVNVGTNWSSYSHSIIRFDEPRSAAEHHEYVTSAHCVRSLRTLSPAFLSSVQVQSGEVQVDYTEYVGCWSSILALLKLTGIYRSRGEASTADPEGGHA